MLGWSRSSFHKANDQMLLGPAAFQLYIFTQTRPNLLFKKDY